MIGLILVNSLIFLIYIKKKKIKFNLNLNVKKLDIFFLLVLFYSLYFFIQNSNKWGQWDAWAIWSLHAKFLFYTDNWQNLFTNRIAWTHPDYPLMLPSMIAMFWCAIGDTTFIIPFFIALLPYIGILILFYFSFKNPVISIVSIIIITLDFSFTNRAAAQYADILLAFFYLLSCILITKIIDEKNNKSNLYYLLGFISSSCLWIKNEGSVFFILICIFIVIKNFRNYNALLKFGIGALIITVVYISFKICYAPSNDLVSKQSGNTLSKIFDIKRYEMILNYFKKMILMKFQIIPILAFIFLLKWRKLSPSLLIIGLTLIIYFAVYIITPYDLQWHLETSLERLIDQIYPSLLFVFLNYFENDFKSPNIIQETTKVLD
ncbi:MAG: hypothetical protein NTZ33_13240 [Bacteroidetes bacterium]|nr:hypothetical protein [Bacteroidota bacterium]